VLLAGALLLTCACGSTVSSTGTGPGSPFAPDSSLSGPGSTAGAPASTGTEVAPVVPGSSSGAGGQPAAGAVGAGQPSAGGITGVTGLRGRGFDATRIVLGYTTSRDANQTVKGLGFDVGTGNTEAQVAAIVRDLNARGGIAGRRIELVVHDFSLANYASDPETETQKACATFTEDRQVFAVLNTIGLGMASLAACLAKHDIPYVDNRFSLTRDPVFGKYPRILYKPSSMNVDTYVPLFIKGLLRQRYFAGWDTVRGDPGVAPVKVGLMHFDTPEWNYYANAIKRELAAAGYPVEKEVTYALGLDNVVPASSSAVLTFREAGITHVFNANIAFIQAAESQQYRPRYSISEEIAPQALTEIAPARQLHGSLGVGYNPFADVEPGSDPQSMNRPAPQACLQVMRKAGQDTSSGTVLQMMMSECDLFNFLWRALRAGGAIGTDAVAAGANAIGASHQSTITFQVQFDARHHAGAVATRSFAFGDACTCYRYVGPAFRS
jgi:hypothetical protein